MIIHTLANARVGLIGNPSDGYFGKTISVTIKNFWAQVTLWESPDGADPAAPGDPVEFDSLESLESVAVTTATTAASVFSSPHASGSRSYAERTGLPSTDGGSLSRTIRTFLARWAWPARAPIVTAAVKALMRFYDIGRERFPRPSYPTSSSALNQELGIAAGLQDRVIQVYGGIVHMDFARDLMEGRGYGNTSPGPRSCCRDGSSLPIRRSPATPA